MLSDRHPRRRVTAPLLPLLGALTALGTACAGDAGSAVWGRGEAVGQLVQERVSRADGGTRVDLRDMAPFRWEALYVLAPGTSLDSVHAALGGPLPGEARLGAQVPDSATLLVFTAGRDVLAAAFLPRARVEMAPAAAGRRYAPDSAAFRVEAAGEGRWRLVRP